MRTKNIELGTCCWRYDDWKGVFIPRGAGDELTFYARHYDTVEVDSTFYYTPAKHVVESWRKRVPEGFRFAAKAPKAITHDKILHNCEYELQEFLDHMSCLEEKRGPILFQFPPYWTEVEGYAVLREFLPLLPEGWKFAMEFRHRSWFVEHTAKLLEAHNVAWALVDFGSWWTGRVQPPLFVTADFTYIRWMGNRNEPLSPFTSIQKDRELEERLWAEAIEELPVSEVWGYFNNHWSGYSPTSTNNFKERLGLPIKNELPGGQGTLF